MPTIRDEDGIIAEPYEEKAALLVKIASPPPIEYNRGIGQPGPEGTAYTHVNRNIVHSALFSQSTKKAPSQDRFGVIYYQVNLELGLLIDLQPLYRDSD
jgi:hypothetical protein